MTQVKPSDRGFLWPQAAPSFRTRYALLGPRSAVLSFQTRPGNCHLPGQVAGTSRLDSCFPPYLLQSTLRSHPESAVGPRGSHLPRGRRLGPHHVREATFHPLGPRLTLFLTSPDLATCTSLLSLEQATSESAFAAAAAIYSRELPHLCLNADLMGPRLMTLFNLQTPFPLPALFFPQHGYHPVTHF